jgi:hypothetical protein
VWVSQEPDVQYNAAAVGGGTQPAGSSFAVHSSHNHVVMATTMPLAGDKIMHVSAERTSTCKAMISSNSTVSRGKIQLQWQL